ncbi:helix-turn-helix transcriptional regulator [Microbacterium suaedae]|uniref:helix-turn-helix transcriptional regulator n=1 Tax=Microbacterium suaedae TaxID=2067813 RepID=UPI0013A66AE0|nr:LuxR C-terminal-related transcriptional regulator [Microbacterium suaedae]
MPDASAKLGNMAIPRPPGTVVHRHRLLQRLDALLPLTVVRGLPGTGKTTLVADWARKREASGDTVAWINAADLPDCAALPDTVGALLGTMDDRRLIVVINEAHRIHDETVAEALCELVVRHASLYLVVCTRVVHPIKRLAQNRGIALTVLTGRDLNAAADELTAFARAWGHEHSPERLRELSDRVGGWLAPLRIALDRDDPDHDEGGYLAASRFLRDHLLPRITDEAFLMGAMTLAVAGEVTEALAQALFLDDPHTPGLLAGHRPAAILASFERHGLLDRVLLPHGTDAWRFPVLIADVLTETFTAQFPDLARHTHRVIADSLPTEEEQGQGGRIIRHARACDHWALLERMWITHGLRLAIDHADDVCAAYDDLPDAVLAEFPALAVAASVVASLRHQCTHAERAALVRSYADAGWALDLASDERRSDAAHDTMAVTSQIIADRITGDPAAAVARAQQHAVEVLGMSTVNSATGTTRAWFELQWALSALAAGDCSSSMNLLARAMNTARTAGADFIVSTVAAQRAMMNAIVGHTHEARDDLATHRGIDTSHQWLHHAIAAPAHLAEALLRLDRLDPTAADFLALVGDGTDSFEEWGYLTWARARYALLFGDPVAAAAETSNVAVLHEGFTRPGSRDQLALDRTFAELFLALGELNRVERHLRDVDPHDVTLAVQRARLALIAGNFSDARSIAAMNAWDPHVVRRDRADLFMIKAAAALAMGDEASAVEAFARGHQLSAASGILIPYAFLPRRVLTSLLDVSGIELSDEVMGVLASCRQVYPEHGELVTLTSRETTILCAMVEHDTLAEIAASLTVSLNTVKKQAAAIYTKLGVHDRATALLRAHKLGLLPHSVKDPGDHLRVSF